MSRMLRALGGFPVFAYVAKQYGNEKSHRTPPTATANEDPRGLGAAGSIIGRGGSVLGMDLGTKSKIGVGSAQPLEVYSSLALYQHSGIESLPRGLAGV